MSKKETANKVSEEPEVALAAEPETTNFVSGSGSTPEAHYWNPAVWCPEAVLAVIGASQRGKVTRVGDLPNIVNDLHGEYSAVKVDGGIELTFNPNSHKPDAARDRLVQLRDMLRHAKKKLNSVTQIADSTPKTSIQISEGLRRSVANAQAEVDGHESEMERVLLATPELRKETLLQQAAHLGQKADKLEKEALDEDESARKWREKGLNPYSEEQVAEMVRANADNPDFVHPDDRNEGMAAQNERQAEALRRQAESKRKEADSLKDEARDLPGVPEKVKTLIPTGSVVGFAL